MVKIKPVDDVAVHKKLQLATILYSRARVMMAKFPLSTLDDYLQS